MIKYFYIVCILFVVLGCPIYDPPMGKLKVENHYSETIYTYITCGQNLPLKPALKMYFNIGDSAFNENGEKIIDTLIFPNYRVESDSIGVLGVFGTPNNPKIPCLDQDFINLFFITESVLSSHAWAKIVKDKLYTKKLTYTQKQLDSLNWIITYYN